MTSYQTLSLFHYLTLTSFSLSTCLFAPWGWQLPLGVMSLFFRARHTWVQIIAQTFASFLTPAKLLNISEPQSVELYRGGK